MPALYFIDEETRERLALELKADLPAPPLLLGSASEKQITNYGARNARSVQITGHTFEPIELSGKWSGRQQGDRERPRNLARAFEALAARQKILRIEWSIYQRWGLLDFKARHTTDDEIEWSLMFTVLYDEPPNSLVVPTFTLAPGESLSLATDQSDKLDATLSRPPVWALGAYVAQLVNAKGSINNALADAQSLLVGVTSYAEISSAQLRQIASSVTLALAGSTRLVDRALAAAEESAASVDATAAQGAAVVRWAGDVEIEARRLRASIGSLLRALVEAIRPPAARRHVVRQGETLYTIATLYFGDFSAWEAIADANNLDSPAVATGLVLSIPDKVELT